MLAFRYDPDDMLEELPCVLDTSNMANEINEIRARLNLGLIPKWEADAQIQAVMAWYMQEVSA